LIISSIYFVTDFPTETKKYNINVSKCLAKKYSGDLCQNNAITGRSRCKFHGGMSLRGDQHWNYQGKGCTKEERQRSVEANTRIRLLAQMAIDLGMIPKKR
jgi:hypothetical protein